jgi:hypothetical protein
MADVSIEDRILAKWRQVAKEHRLDIVIPGGKPASAAAGYDREQDYLWLRVAGWKYDGDQEEIYLIRLTRPSGDDDRDAADLAQKAQLRIRTSRMQRHLRTMIPAEWGEGWIFVEHEEGEKWRDDPRFYCGPFCDNELRIGAARLLCADEWQELISNA